MTTSTAQDAPSSSYGVLFHPVEGGYLLETPNPWIFGRGPRFIVTEAQRSALLNLMRARRAGLRITLSVAGLLAFTVVVSLLWWLFSGHDNPTGFDLVGMTVTLLGPLYIAAVVMVRRHLRRIAPILAAAVPTQARLTGRERARAPFAMPTKLLDAAIVVWAVAAVFAVAMLAIQPTPSNVGWAAFATAFAASLLYRRWQRKAS